MAISRQIQEGRGIFSKSGKRGLIVAILFVAASFFNGCLSGFGPEPIQTKSLHLCYTYQGKCSSEDVMPRSLAVGADASMFFRSGFLSSSKTESFQKVSVVGPDTGVVRIIQPKLKTFVLRAIKPGQATLQFEGFAGETKSFKVNVKAIESVSFHLQGILDKIVSKKLSEKIEGAEFVQGGRSKFEIQYFSADGERLHSDGFSNVQKWFNFDTSRLKVEPLSHDSLLVHFLKLGSAKLGATKGKSLSFQVVKLEDVESFKALSQSAMPKVGSSAMALYEAKTTRGKLALGILHQVRMVNHTPDTCGTKHLLPFLFAIEGLMKGKCQIELQFRDKTAQFQGDIQRKGQ